MERKPSKSKKAATIVKQRQESPPSEEESRTVIEEISSAEPAPRVLTLRRSPLILVDVNKCTSAACSNCWISQNLNGGEPVGDTLCPECQSAGESYIYDNDSTDA